MLYSVAIKLIERRNMIALPLIKKACNLMRLDVERDCIPIKVYVI
jgi:hypothetical protein